MREMHYFIISENSYQYQLLDVPNNLASPAMSVGAVPELKRPADFHSILGGFAGCFGYK
jgi:hypothetical protein